MKSDIFRWLRLSASYIEVTFLDSNVPTKVLVPAGAEVYGDGIRWRLTAYQHVGLPWSAVIGLCIPGCTVRFDSDVSWTPKLAATGGAR